LKKKILVIRFGSFGDVILTTPVTRALKEKFADAELHVLTKHEFATVFKNSPYVDKVISFDTKKVSSLSQLLEFSKQLNYVGYNIVIDLHRNLRSRIISLSLDVERKLYYKKEALKRRLLVGFGVRFKSMPHTVDKYLNTLKPLGIEHADRIPFINTDDSNEMFADKFFKEKSISDTDTVIAISPGAKNMAKMYPKEKFITLINMITAKKNTRVLLIGSKSDEHVIIDIYSGVKDRDKLAVLTAGTINESAAVIKKCSRFVTNDSGPMHLSVSVGTPVIALFGPTDEDFGFYPLGKDDIVITKGYECSPCSLHGKKVCTKYSYRCLNDITENEVFEKLNIT